MPSALSTPAPCARRASPCVCVPYTRAQLLPAQEKLGWLGFPGCLPVALGICTCCSRARVLLRPPVETLPPSFAFPCQGSPSNTPSTALFSEGLPCGQHSLSRARTPTLGACVCVEHTSHLSPGPTADSLTCSEAATQGRPSSHTCWDRGGQPSTLPGNPASLHQVFLLPLPSLPRFLHFSLHTLPLSGSLSLLLSFFLSGSDWLSVPRRAGPGGFAQASKYSALDSCPARERSLLRRYLPSPGRC